MTEETKSSDNEEYYNEDNNENISQSFICSHNGLYITKY
jgi:hypothetical protein